AEGASAAVANGADVPATTLWAFGLGILLSAGVVAVAVTRLAPRIDPPPLAVSAPPPPAVEPAPHPPSPPPMAPSPPEPSMPRPGRVLAPRVKTSSFAPASARLVINVR